MRSADRDRTGRRPENFPGAIVDAHHHLWQLAHGSYPWLQDEYDAKAFFLGDYSSLQHDFDTSAYLRRTEGLPIVATVHVEAERARTQALDEVRWLHDVQARHGFPNAIVAWADCSAPDVDEALRALKSSPLVRGVRCKPRTGTRPGELAPGAVGSMQDQNWLAGLSAIACHGLSWDLRVPFWHLSEAAEVAAQFPALPIMLNHAGLPWDRSEAGLAQWRKGMHALAQHATVCVKLSEFGLAGRDWNRTEVIRIVRDTIDIFGWDRCVFASNLPVSGLRVDMPTLVDTLCEALGTLAPAAQAAIWHDNAIRFYDIGKQS